MTHYYTDISPELLKNDPQWPAGFRLIARLYDDSCWIGRPERVSERWYVEDDKAPKRLEGMLVDPEFTRNEKTGTIRVSSRTIRKVHPLNDM